MITDPETLMLMRLYDSSSFDEAILPCSELLNSNDGDYYRTHCRFLGFISGFIESDNDLIPFDFNLDFPVLAIHLFWQPSELLWEFHDVEFSHIYSGDWCLLACGNDFQHESKLARFETEEQAREVAAALTGQSDLRGWYFVHYL